MSIDDGENMRRGDGRGSRIGRFDEYHGVFRIEVVMEDLRFNSILIGNK